MDDLIRLSRKAANEWRNSDAYYQASVLIDSLCDRIEHSVPVVHAKWEDYHFIKADCPQNGFPTVKCPRCEIAFCDIINNHRFMYHYCPNCGARMDLED